MEEQAPQDLLTQSSQAVKRPSSSADADENSKRSKMNETTKPPYCLEIDPRYSHDNTYCAGGLKHSLHGNVYQLKMQMFFLKRALDKGYEFNLGTEVEDAQKFDDIVFKYKKNESHNIRFVQIKHKQDQSIKITYNDLSTQESDFSLQKYFVSYRAINKKFIFSSVQAKDFILYTNIDFDHDDLTKFKIRKNQINETDDILDIQGTKHYKLIIPKGHSLYETLRETSDLHLLAKQLALHITENKKLCLKPYIFKLYHYVLCQEVFIIFNDDGNREIIEPGKSHEIKQTVKKYVKFQDNFLSGNSLSEYVNNLGITLKVILRRDKNASKTDLSKIKLRVSANFGVVFHFEHNPTILDPKKFAGEIAQIINKAHENYIIRISRRSHIIRDNINNLAGHVLVQAEEDEKKNLVRFRKMFFDNNHSLEGNLNEFRIALIEELQKEDKIDFYALKFYRFEINDFKTCEETFEGQLLLPRYVLPSDNVDDTEIESFFKELILAVNQPDEITLGNIIANELKENPQFNLLNADLVAASFQSEMLNWFKEKRPKKGQEGVWLNKISGQAFFHKIEQQISSLMCAGTSLAYIEDVQAYNISFSENSLFDRVKDFLSDTEKVLHIHSPEATILSTINFLNALQSSYPQYKKYDSYIFQPLSRILSVKIQDYLIKTFESKGSHDLFIINCECISNEDEIKTLYDKLSGKLLLASKKIVLISKEGHTLVSMFAIPLKNNFRDDVSFNYLSKQSKRYLFERQLTFQNSNTNLKQLYFNKQPSDEQLSQLDIDTKTLVQLITNDALIIGSKPPSKSNLEGAYSKISTFVDVNVLIERLEESNEIFFVLSGFNKSNKKEDLINNLKANSNTPKIVINLDNMCELKMMGNELHSQNFKRIMVADSEFKEKYFYKLCCDNPSKIFYWITLQDKRFILHTIYYPHFLERNFQYPKSNISLSNDINDIRKELLKYDDNNIFYITGAVNSDNLVINDDSDKIIIQPEGNRDEFLQLMSKKSKESQNQKSVHWLRIKKNNELTWHDVTREEISENKLIDYIHKESSIIIDQPGMGKSTSLTTLSEKIPKLFWPILINLRNWQRELVALPDSISDINSVVHFLSDTQNLNTPLEKQLANYSLDKKHLGGVKLLLLFDGFDEIRSYDNRNVNIGKEKFEKLLRFLKQQTRSIIWITAREHDADVLKNILSVFDIKFQPLNEPARVKYFKDSWRNSLLLRFSESKLHQIFSTDGEFQKYYAQLSKKVNEILADEDNDFMGVPLTIRLFADAFRNKFIAYIDSKNDDCSKDFENLNILNLYKEFVDAKFEIFLSEKTHLSSGFNLISAYWFKEKLVKLHCRLALKELFGDERVCHLLGEKKTFKWKNYVKINANKLSLENLEQSELLNIGIIRFITEDRYEFLHRTLAEYFASEMFAYVLKTRGKKFQRFTEFIKKNISSKRDQVIYKFLNARSQEDSVLNDTWEYLKMNVEYDKLLGVTCNKNIFKLDISQNDQEEGLLKSLRQIVEDSVAWVGPTFRYNVKTTDSTTSYRCICVEKLISESIVTQDVKELAYTLEYLAILYDKTAFRWFQLALTVEHMLLLINHYVFQSENQGNFDEDLIERCYRKMFALKIKSFNSVTEQERCFHEFINAPFDGKWVYELINENMYLIFQARLLTPEIVKKFIYLLDREKWNLLKVPQWCILPDHKEYIKKVYYELIIPLLIMKDVNSSFRNIDSVALLDMFQAFTCSSENFELHERSLQSLFKCMRETLDIGNISEESLYICLRCLMVLNNWNLQVSFKNSILYVDYGNGKDYHKPLNLHFEGKIVQLLRSALDNPNNLRIECQYVAESILSRKVDTKTELNMQITE